MGSADVARGPADRLLDFWVAMAALAGMLLGGSATVMAVQTGAWVSAALFGQPTLLCVIIVVANIVVEAMSATMALFGALAAPLLAIPPLRRRIERIRAQWQASSRMS
ncbi:hypothetical protein [Nocardia sp. NPDC051570]|uniref:hypothetical protein n=1 Tax=Nocardia sp. NPDC051570 TaxID=3364324 RepID=UPI0037A1D8BD